MKILIPVSTFERAGGFRVLSELGTHWTRAGASVDFLVDHRSADPYFPTEARVLRFDSSGAEPAPGARAAFKSRGNASSIFVGMWRALDRVSAQYDVLLANHSFTALPVALARTRARKYYYVQAYEPEYYGLEPGWRNIILKHISAFSYRLPLRQVANAPIYVGYRGIKATEWIPPGLDNSLFVRRQVAPSFADDRPIVLGTIGRREPSKGTADVLTAFMNLARTDPRVSLRVAYGNLPAGWSHPRCEIVIPANDMELAAYYRSIDILLAPGTVQLGACHYPVIESMASGTPVVTTGYLPADEHNAWIVPVHAPQAIEGAVRAVASLPADLLNDKLSRAATAVERFGWRRVADDFLCLLSSDLRFDR